MAPLNGFLPDALLDKIATEKDITHTPGKKLKNRQAFAEFLPNTVEVRFPAVAYGGEEVGPLSIRMTADLDWRAGVKVEVKPEVFAYVRAAMIASKTATSGVAKAAPRARPSHADRFTTTTGIKGVFWVKQRKCMQRKFKNSDGRTEWKHKKLAQHMCADDAAATKDQAELLKHLDPNAGTDAAVEEGVDDGSKADGDAPANAAGDADAGESSSSHDGAALSTLKRASSSSASSGPPTKIASISAAWQNVFKKRDN